MNSAELEKAFNEFWCAYPRKVGKLAARKAYAKALRVVSPAALTEGAQRYARERAGQDATYTKHPATWLNAGCWGDNEPSPDVRTENTGFYASFTSPELEAWEAYGQRTKGRGYPKDKHGGWTFPARWPPAQKA